MAMLAEPRRKRKIINLRAKNSEWSNDSNKFGQRMLEKMGWSTGKGLGANENGIVEHVIAKYKNDDKGLGYEDKNDQWTKHEDDFNALLSNLSSDKDDKKEALHSGVSLEVKSKNSKARIHYHKFTRGKDLSRYSEKDLANIFGKKSFKEEVLERVKNVDIKQKKSTEQIFTEKGSMDDYFKGKMAALKVKNKANYARTDEHDNPDYIFQGFSTIKDSDNVVEEIDTSLYNTTNNSDDMIIQEVIGDKSSKKSKKKKSKKEGNESTNNGIQEYSYKCDNTENIGQVTSVSKSQKEHTDDEAIHVPKKSKKNKKNRECDEESSEIKDAVTANDINKKKSKKSNSEILENSEQVSENNSIDYIPKKKKKKNKD